MTFSSLWGRTTGADKGKTFPVQEADVLGRVGDYSIVSPYGLYADLPFNTFVKEIGPGVLVSATINRPSDLAQGEPAFFHPTTDTRIVARNSGDLDIFSIAGEEKANVNISCKQANITADDSTTITAPDIILAGKVTTEEFGTNGKSAQASATLSAVATDLPTVIALANTIRAALIANGIGS